MPLPRVSILVPMRNEEDFIEDCLTSLRAQAYPPELLEILVLDGDSTDRSPELVRAISTADPRVRLVHNPGRNQAAALNLGLEAATGDILVRTDAHAIYGPSYVPTVVDHLQAGRAESVGGQQRGQGNSYFGRAVAAALNTPLGAGNAPYRLATAPCYVDTVWLGAWRKETVRALGGFDEAMVPNEDYEFNIRLRAAGGRILLDPALPSVYYPRTSPARLWRQYFRYGLAKVRVLKRYPESLVVRQLIPPLLVFALVASLALTPVTSLPAVVVWGGYLAAILLGSLLTARRHGGRLLPALLLIFPMIHLSWGLSIWWALVRLGGIPFHRTRVWQAERHVQEKPPEETLPVEK
jgi:succinoglycan biosynthesis protein ExoA